MIKLSKISALLTGLFLIILLVPGCKNQSSQVVMEFNDPSQIDSLFDVDNLVNFDSLSGDSLEEEELRDMEIINGTITSTTGSTIKRLVIHCTASNILSPNTRESLLKFFKEERKWSKPGYTFFIDRNGIIWKLNSYWNWDPIINYSEITFGATGYNSTSLHVAWDGGVQDNKVLDNRTPKQKASLDTFVKITRDIYPNIDVLGHRDLPGVNKLCPLFDVRSEYNIKKPE